MRPTEYDDELARDIAFTMTVSPTPLHGLCELYDHWPTMDTIVQWKRTHKEFAELMADGIALRETLLSDEIMSLLNDESRTLEEIEAEIGRFKSVVEPAG